MRDVQILKSLGLSDYIIDLILKVDTIYAIINNLGSVFDSTVLFSVNANPNTVGTTFSPNSPRLTTVLYVSTIDDSLWEYSNGLYKTYVPPVIPVKLSSLTAADRVNSITNGNFGQTWNWGALNGNALSLNAQYANNGIGSVLSLLASGSTTSATPNCLQIVNSIDNGGANNRGITVDCINASFAANSRVIAGYFYAHSTTAVNVAMHLKATGTADNAIALLIEQGCVKMHGSAVEVCAKMDIASTTQGVLLPRMTKAQRNLIASPIADLEIYQTDNTPGKRVYNGTNWMKFTETAD
ncbi:MAG: hypothetical protein ACQUYJ_13645 [Ferruginibacter sp.]